MNFPYQTQMKKPDPEVLTDWTCDCASGVLYKAGRLICVLCGQTYWGMKLKTEAGKPHD